MTTFEHKSSLFADEVRETLAGVLPGKHTIVSVRLAEGPERYVVRPNGDSAKDWRVPICVGGEQLAALSVVIYLAPDSFDSYLKAERGAFSHLLARAHAMRPQRVLKPHDLSSLHLPVGGERFRPCLEDVLEFLVLDCGVDHVEGWQTVVQAGRERWRLRQLGSAVRDSPHKAAGVLRELGWTVTCPSSRIDLSQSDVLRKW